VDMSDLLTPAKKTTLPFADFRLLKSSEWTAKNQNCYLCLSF